MKSPTKLPKSFGPCECGNRNPTNYSNGARKIWERTYGAIAEGLCVLHRCDNPPCWNPLHLFLGTKRDNTQDMIKKHRHVGNVGKIASLETREKMRISHLGKVFGPMPESRRIKIRLALQGIKHSPESNAKRSATLKGRPKPKDFGKKVSAALKGKPKSPEHRARLSAATKAAWAAGKYVI